MLGQLHGVDIRLLQVFRSVVRCGGFAAARAELGASLPTISLQMKQLEERLGLRLCERGNAGFRLTAQGEGVLKATKRLFAGLEECGNLMSELASIPVGEVRLGVIANLMNNPACQIHSAIAAIQQSVPGVTVTFFVGPPSELETQVLAGTLDIAIGLFASRHTALNYSVLFEEEHVLYCGSQHALAADTSSAVDSAAIMNVDYVSWSYLEPSVAAQSPFKFVPKTGTPFMEGVACLVLSGRYIGYLPRYFAKQWVEQNLVKALWSSATSRQAEVLLIRRKVDEVRPAVNLLVEAMLNAHAVV
jgi:DNA-binding transcriptional LysR family regulator